MWKYALWPLVLPEHGFTDEGHPESSTPMVLDRILVAELFMARLDHPYIRDIKIATWFRFIAYELKVYEHVDAARHPFLKGVRKLFIASSHLP